MLEKAQVRLIRTETKPFQFCPDDCVCVCVLEITYGKSLSGALPHNNKSAFEVLRKLFSDIGGGAAPRPWGLGVCVCAGRDPYT